MLLATVNLDVGISSDSSSGSGVIPVIAGSVGGVVLFLIILFSVAFIYCKRRLQKKVYTVPTVPSDAVHSICNKGL